MYAFGLVFWQTENSPAWQARHAPHEIGNGTTTRSPTASFFTFFPTSTTSPMNSWPRMSPGSMNGLKPLYRCRSEPQIAVDVTFTMQSFWFRIFGSGTFRTSIFCFPAQQVAFICCPPCQSGSTDRERGPREFIHSELRRLVVRLRVVRPALLGGVGEHDLADLHHLLEVAQVVVDLLPGLFTEEHRDPGAKLPEWRVVLELDANLGAAIAGRRMEFHGTRIVDLGVLGRPPCDALVLGVLDRLGIPLHGPAGWCLGDPVRAALPGDGDRLAMPHALRDVLDVLPELADFRDRLVDGDAARRADDPLVGAFVGDRPGLLGQLLRGHDIECRYRKHVRGREQRRRAIVVTVAERLAEEREVERVTGDTRPHRFRRLLVREHRKSVRDLAHAHEAHDEAVLVVMRVDAARTRDDAGHRDLREAESEAEHPEEVGE